MKKVFVLVCCSIFLFTGCGSKSYLQTIDTTNSESDIDISESENLISDSTIYIQVAGAVKCPGVYELPYDSRVFVAIEAAGGLSEDADDSDINQASIMTDGDKLYVYTVDERKEIAEAKDDNVDGLININNASVDELKSLPGIGESKARQIIAYRETNGLFNEIEDIKNVTGVGEGIFAQISSFIKV